jgi:hypothetical protein
MVKGKGVKTKMAKREQEQERMKALELRLGEAQWDLEATKQRLAVTQSDLANSRIRESNLELERTALFQALWDIQKERKQLRDELDAFKRVTSNGITVAVAMMKDAAEAVDNSGAQQ